MVMETFPVLIDAARLPCAKPENLALVDAAFAKPGGPAGQQMRDELCTGCPNGERCLAWAMTWREDGVWGGVSPNARTRHGAPGADGLRAHHRQRAS